MSTIAIVGLLVFEYGEYRKVEWKPELVVDKSRTDQMTIHFDISFPKVPCFGIWSCVIGWINVVFLGLTLDVMDAADQFQNNMHDHIVKTRLNPNGDVISLYDGIFYPLLKT